MRKTLLRNSIILMITVFIVFFIILVISLYRFQLRQRQEMMILLLEEIELAYDLYEGPDIVFVKLYNLEDGRRITILDQDMIVLADNYDSVIGTDKSNRPELLSPGTLVTRTSDTVGVELLYIAKQSENGNYIRVSIPVQSYARDYQRLILILVFSGVLITTIYSLSMDQVSKQLLKPFDQLKQTMKELKEGHLPLINFYTPYKEINEALKDINEIQLEISSYIETIEQYKSKLNKVLNEMKQAILMFDGKTNLQYYNQNAKRIFSFQEDAIGKTSQQLIRDLKIRDAITNTLSNHQFLHNDVLINHQTYQLETFFISSGKTSHQDQTVLLILTDVSHQRALEQVKRDFFSHASHELKSPITAIKGYAELIFHQVIHGEETSNAADQIIYQTNLMSNLVEDMLMLSRLEHLKEENHSKTSLNQIINNVSQMLEPLAKSKNIKVNYEIATISMVCDPVDMRNLFKNIIENAIKYSNENQHVKVLLDQDQNDIIFKVIDEGIGIRIEHQQRIFERFYRVDKGRLDGGTGLGLAIVKHVVIKYKGTIDLKSESLKGTEITVRMKKNQSQI
jgi:two-component system, OmpR family, phosphate regulon sensor histidine kinase PhoR